jgi:hypothetical protein
MNKRMSAPFWPSIKIQHHVRIRPKKVYRVFGSNAFAPIALKKGLSLFCPIVGGWAFAAEKYKVA